MSAFKKEFQEMAGKIVKSNDFWNMVDARVAPDHSIEELTRYMEKRDSLSAEDKALCDALGKERTSTLYIVAADYEGIVTTPTLAAPTIKETRAVFLDTMDALLKDKDTMHIKVQPLLRLAFVMETDAMAKACLEAAQSCADTSPRLEAGELVTLGDANRALRKKLDDKFGKFSWI